MTQANDQLREKRVELILQQLEDLPTLPAVAIRVLEVTGSDDSSAAEVVSLITSDPALTTRILQLVHRADVGVRGQVTSVDRAVSLLGFEAVRSAVLAVSVFQTFADDSPNKTGHFSREEFWKHSVAVACCAELMAAALSEKRESGVDPAEAFVCGLLHDLGKVALDAVLPKSFDRVVEAADLLRSNIADLERTVIGLDHMVVGKRLAERWQLPPAVRDSVWLHGQLPQALPATVKNPRLVNLVTLADLIVREQHLGYSGNYTFGVSRTALMEAVGVTPEQVLKVQQGLVEQIEPRAQALGLGQTSTNELYQQALAQANKELGRVSGQLAGKNRKLAVRAKFFDALSGFQSVLRPDAPPQTVLKAIGQTAITVLDVRSACAFSLVPGQTFAEALLFDQSGEVFQNTLIDCPPPATEAGTNGIYTLKYPTRTDGPILPVSAELEWLVSAVSPRLTHDQRYWIALEAEGQCIGGVIWGGPAGEAQRLSPQSQELIAIAGGWSLALRTAQIRDEARTLAEQLAEANRQLHNAQSEILRSKTMIMVGEMAAGAAHEMNNPLAIISGRSQLLSSQLSDPKQQNAAKLIYEQSHRLSGMISELMDFARPQPPQPQALAVGELVDQALSLAKMRSNPADRTIERTIQEVPLVRVDVEQVTAALVEVIDNAIQATDDKTGHLMIMAAFDPYSNRVVMTVADNGCGMDENTVRHAFDPFFSFKPAGRRRGMGLARASRWIESNGGSIRLESRREKGTRTLILLPAATEPAVENQPEARKVVP